MPETSAAVGTVTFLYTDIQGSTSLWQEHPSAMPAVMERHDTLLREVVTVHAGTIFRSMGDGMCAAFTSPSSAVRAAVAAQKALFAESWPEDCDLRVRMAIHTGPVDARDGDYVGHTLNRVARLLSAGHGGQILISSETAALIRGQLTSGWELRDLGERRLKDLVAPEHIFQCQVPGLPDQFPPLTALDVRPGNLPIQVTPFIGRAREMEEVLALLRRSDVRLLTLTGPGGTGKTRLSLQAAAQLVDHFPNGVFFVPLASIADADLVASAIASALEVSEEAGQALTDSLKIHLKAKRLLLLLDNCEHLLEATPLIGELLATCPDLVVLATSRSPLHLAAEHEYPVPRLALPDRQEHLDLDTLSRCDAVAFFLNRARAVKPDLELTGENARAVVELCWRLDGLPLALELAAARIKLFPPRALLQRLSAHTSTKGDHKGSTLQLLTGGAKDRPARQQTLRGAIDWSYSLLSPDEQMLFTRMSVFAGGCTLEAAEAVCDGEGRLDLLQEVGSLVDKSLLRQEGEEEPRFSMLETVREYAGEKLAERGEESALRKGHASYFLQMGEEADPALRGPRQGEWLARLERELDNLRGAMSWFLEHGQVEEELRLASALYFFWLYHGYWSEGWRRLEEGLAPGHRASASVQAKAYLSLGTIAFWLAECDRATLLLEQALEQFRELGDTRGTDRTLNNLGLVAWRQGRYERATALYEESLRLSRDLGDRRGAAITLYNLGIVATEQRDWAAARDRLTAALDIFQAVGDTNGIAMALVTLGELARHEGSLVEAETRLVKSMRLARKLGAKKEMAQALENLGAVAREQGRLELARERLRESLLLARELGHRYLMLDLLRGMARLAVAEDEPERAARLEGAEVALRESLSAPLPPVHQDEVDAIVTEARRILGEEGFGRSWERGRAMTLADAVAHALDEYM